MQKVVVIFSSPDFTAQDYDKVWDDLRAAGQSKPKGLLSHAGFAKPEGGWMVIEIWESTDAFNEFGKTLMPIIQKIGKNVPPPQVTPAYYVLIQQSENAPA